MTSLPPDTASQTYVSLTAVQGARTANSASSAQDHDDQDRNDAGAPEKHHQWIGAPLDAARRQVDIIAGPAGQADVLLHMKSRYAA
jgi:hypothetical protein